MVLHKRFGGVVALAIVAGSLAACGDDTTEPPPPDDSPTIALTAPTGGDPVIPGDDVTISWNAQDDNAVVGVDLYYNSQAVAFTQGGAVETLIVSDVQGSTYDWTTPDGPLYGVTIRAVAKDSEGQTGEDTSDDIFAIVQYSARGYVQSEVCGDCHAAAYQQEQDQNGHPYKLNKVANGMAPTYPDSDVPNPPAGYTWDDVTYVIGGYGWKARFIGTDGYIITPAAGLNQYNLATQGWVDYHPGEVRPYNCGPCHMTGWQTLAENGGVNQDGLEGIHGTWEEPGIRCEECHGAGADHVSMQLASEISIDETSEACGKCHQRGGLDVNPEASGGFIRHHEQYNEWNLSAHAGADIGCGSCHDSHIGVLYGNQGIITECEDCHPDKVASNNHIAGPTCVDCHMSRATKSAIAENSFKGDVKAHIFTINPQAVGKADMFYAASDGKTRTNAFVTLDFACYGCHTDPNTLEGGGFSQKTLGELSSKATGIHD